MILKYLILIFYKLKLKLVPFSLDRNLLFQRILYLQHNIPN